MPLNETDLADVGQSTRDMLIYMQAESDAVLHEAWIALSEDL